MKKIDFLSSLKIYLFSFLYGFLISLALLPFFIGGAIIFFYEKIKPMLTGIENKGSSYLDILMEVKRLVSDHEIKAIFYVVAVYIILMAINFFIFRFSFKKAAQRKYKNFQLSFVVHQPYIKIFVVSLLAYALVSFGKITLFHFVPSIVDYEGNIVSLFFLLHVVFETYIFMFFLNRGIANKTIKLSAYSK